MDGWMMEQDSGDRGLAIWPFSPVWTAEWTRASPEVTSCRLMWDLQTADLRTAERSTSPSLKNTSLTPVNLPDS